MMKSVTFEVFGDQRLACDGCEQRIERVLKQQPGIQKVRANARNQRIEVLFDTMALEPATISEHIAKAGYQNRAVNPD